MNELYRPEKNSFADEIAEKLQELVLAHRIVICLEDESFETSLPFIREGGRIIRFFYQPAKKPSVHLY